MKEIQYLGPTEGIKIFFVIIMVDQIITDRTNTFVSKCNNLPSIIFLIQFLALSIYIHIYSNLNPILGAENDQVGNTCNQIWYGFPSPEKDSVLLKHLNFVRE